MNTKILLAILTLINFIVLSSAYSQFDDAKTRRNFGKRGYYMSTFDTLLPSSFNYHFRPLLMFVVDLTYGLVHGFTNFNLDLPLFCLFDAPSALSAYFDINAAYKATKDEDVLTAASDVMGNLEFNCNPLTIGGGTISALYLMYPEWILHLISN